MNRSLPNIFTWSRIIMAPLIPVLYYAGSWWPFVALVVFIAAAVSDYIDGKLARDFGNGSPLGKFLDPVADKILVIIVLMTLVVEPEPVINRTLLAVLTTVVILREVIQSSLRDWMAQQGRAAAVGVTTMSKTKTALQLVALGFLVGYKAAALVVVAIGLPPWVAVWLVAYVGVLLLVIAMVLGLTSMVQFLRIAFRPTPTQTL